MEFSVRVVTPLNIAGDIRANTNNIIDCLADGSYDLTVLPGNALCGDIQGMMRFPAVQNELDCALAELNGHIKSLTILGLNDSTAVVYQNKEFNKVPFGSVVDTKLGRIYIAGMDILTNDTGKIDADIVVIPCVFPMLIGCNKVQLAVSLSARLDSAVILCSNGNGNSSYNYVRSALKLVCNKGGLIKSSDLEQDIVTCKVDPNDIPKPYKKANDRQPDYIPNKNECDLAFRIIAKGIYLRLKQVNAKRVILGLSGGLDSSFALVALCKAFERYGLNPKDIIAVSMPSGVSSDRTKSNAQILAQQLNVSFHVIPINKELEVQLDMITHTKEDVVYENAQARIRTMTLLNMGNKYNGIVIGTGDLFETALGFSTFGGDQLYHYNPVSSLTKSAMRFMLNSLIEAEEFSLTARSCLTDILNTPVSPELKAGQLTENEVGDIRLHEYFLLRLLAYKESTPCIIEGAIKQFGLSKDIVNKNYRIFISRFFVHQFKRVFTGDGLQLTPYDIAEFDIGIDFNNSVY